MPGLLFHRQIRISVADLLIQNLRMQVEIERPADSTQTTGKAAIFNLSIERESQVYDKGGPIRIEAGYPSTIATIFSGRVQRVRRSRQIGQVVHRVLKMDLGDETHTVGRLSVTSRAYSGAEQVRNIVVDLAADMGLPVRPDPIPTGLVVRDWSASGAVTDLLTDVLDPFGFAWFEDDGVIVPYPAGETATTDDQQPQALSAQTGLIGVPEETDEGAQATMLLNPAIQRGSFLLIDSVTAAGLWRVVALKHQADNRGRRFQTWVDLRAAA